MDERLSVVERIRRKSDFARLYREGRRWRGRFFSLIYKENGLGFSRLAVVAGRKVGPAVVRNRAKRRFRELFRRRKDLFGEPTDIIVLVRPEAAEAPWTKLRDDYEMALTKIFGKRTSA